MGIWEKPTPDVPRRARRRVRLRAAARARRATSSRRSARCATAGPRCSSAWAATSSAPPRTPRVTEAALRGCRLTVQVSTKLNRSHAVTGEPALILPTLGPHRARRAGGRRRSSSPSRTRWAWCTPPAGRLAPASPRLLSRGGDRLPRWRSAALGAGSAHRLGRRWSATTTLIRDHIARVVPGFDGLQRAASASPAASRCRTRRATSAAFPHRHRQGATSPSTRSRCCGSPPGRLLLQTVRSHDQYNTTIYGLDDRYRGIKAGRRVVFVNPDDLAAPRARRRRDRRPRQRVDGRRRAPRAERSGSSPTRPRAGCAAAYFPETNVLVPLDSTAEVSNTPTSKSVVVRLEPARP